MTWVEPIVLVGERVTLEPLDLSHAEAWHRCYDPEVFRFHSRGGPADETLAAMRAFITQLNALPNRLNWAVRVGNDVAGRISYSEIRASDRGLEIGTTVMPPYQGTFVNPEAKFLLLRHAFETLGALRVQFKVDSRNARSQRAVEKLGAVREGVLRKYQVRPDGFARDSAVYAITDDDWPRVKTILEERLRALKLPSP